MDDRAYWTKQLREAERELDAANKLVEVRAAARKLRIAKQELKWLDGEAKTRGKRK